MNLPIAYGERMTNMGLLGMLFPQGGNRTNVDLSFYKWDQEWVIAGIQKAMGKKINCLN